MIQYCPITFSPERDFPDEWMKSAPDPKTAIICLSIIFSQANNEMYVVYDLDCAFEHVKSLHITLQNYDLWVRIGLVKIKMFPSALT